MSFLVTILGGLGVFLLGMKLLSDNLRSAAGDALRVLLSRFTSGRLSSVGTGTIFTALVQSSSATTLATIGFVSAGLLTFTQALGVIFGANLGTTATSWLVATLGLRVSISAFAYPMVGLGALATLLTKGRKAHIGGAVAGFGLIFIGIDILQIGMADLAAEIDLTAISGEGMVGRLMLVGIGFVMTVLMQSSSAAIAATLTALFAGAVDLPQAAALVIGQSVGTTVTAALGAIGASLAARRTAVAHILFNLVTGALALMALPLFLMAHGAWVEAGRAVEDAIAIAIFHTSFKIMGVAVLLPIVEPFSKVVYRIVPGTEPQYGAGLDASAAEVPAVAVAAVRRAQMEMYEALVEALSRSTEGDGQLREQEFEAIAGGLRRCREFLEVVETDPHQSGDHDRHLAVLHTLDHLERLMTRVLAGPGRLGVLAEIEEVEEVVEAFGSLVETAGEVGEQTELAGGLDELCARVVGGARRGRHDLLKAATTGRLDPDELTQLLEALKWSRRTAFHLWRAAHYLEGGTFEPSREYDESLDE